MSNARYALSIDAGGTFLKSAIVDSGGNIFHKRINQTPVDSSGSTESILSTFTEVILSAFDTARCNNIFIDGIGIGIPGPFDYSNATSYMKHKFQALCGLNLIEALSERIELLREKRVVFAHDAHTFLIGEMWSGMYTGYSRIVGITIGTGIGIGFMVNDRIVDDGCGGPLKSICRMPCQGATLEDFVSKRGIIAEYERKRPSFFKDGLDVKTIAEMARGGECQAAIEVFKQVGFILGSHLKGILNEFRCELLILGGQISKAFDLFADGIRSELLEVPTLRNITRAKDIEMSPLYGAAKLVFDKSEKVEG